MRRRGWMEGKNGGEDEGGKRRKKEIMKRSQVPNIHYDNVDLRAEIQNT